MVVAPQLHDAENAAASSLSKLMIVMFTILRLPALSVWKAGVAGGRIMANFLANYLSTMNYYTLFGIVSPSLLENSCCHL